MIAYSSRTTNGREAKFSATESECLGVTHALEAFRPYLEVYQFEVVTDHSRLLWLHKLKNPSGRLARWAIYLQQFNMKLIHKKGAAMQAPDALSRNAIDDPDVNEKSCPEVFLVDLPQTIEDKWYLKMVDCVKNDPESYSKFSLKDNQIFKLITVHPDLPLKWVQVIPRGSRRALLEECHGTHHF